MGTHSRVGVERLGGRDPEDEPTEIGKRSTTQRMMQYERMANLGCGTWTDRAVTPCVRSLHVRGHTCSLRPLTSPRGGCKGGETRCDVIEVAHFALR